MRHPEPPLLAARLADLRDAGLPFVADALARADALGNLGGEVPRVRAMLAEYGLLGPVAAAVLTDLADDCAARPAQDGGGNAAGPGYEVGQLSLLGQADVLGFGTPDFAVRCIQRDRANALIIRGHYSGKVFPLSEEHHGVHVNGALVGVLQWGPGMNPASGGGVVAGTKAGQWLELNRMWLDDAAPHGIATRAIAYSIRLLRRRRPEVAWLQSFADERCGKNGLVYQAANFLYLGEHTSVFWELDGQWYHNIAATVGPAELRKRKGAAVLQANLDRAIRHEFRQFRYFFPLKKAARRGLLLTPQPYPTRPGHEAP